LAWSHFKHVETTFAGGVASFKVCYGELELQPVFVDLVSLLHTEYGQWQIECQNGLAFGNTRLPVSGNHGQMNPNAKREQGLRRSKKSDRSESHPRELRPSPFPARPIYGHCRLRHPHRGEGIWKDHDE
jgi:hypothetical protein